MYKWCATVAMSALMALPVLAQPKNNAGDDGSGGSGTTERNTTETNAANVAPPLRSSAGLPDAPRATPFPKAAEAQSDEPGRVWPRFEVAVLYQYLNFQPGDPFPSVNTHGGAASFAYNASRWIGLVGEVGVYRFHQSTVGSGVIESYLFGPRLNLRKFDHIVPFGEFLVGSAHRPALVTGDKSESTFAMAAGGGVDVVLTKNIAWRFAQLDYLLTNFSGPALGTTSRQNNFRAGTGVVIRWGIPEPPPPPNRPPVAACSVTPTSVIVGSNDSVAVHVNASDPDNDTLTYTYTATGGTVEGTGPDARWNSSGLSQGTYTVNVKVDDGKGGTATCSADIKAEPKPRHPIALTLSTDRNPIMVGERTGITATPDNPDNAPLTFSYKTTGGQIVGQGPKVEFDSTGVQPGSYTVTGTITDDIGQTAEASTKVDVQQPPPPPQATKVGDCSYRTAGSSRVDNVCKRVLDDVALRLKNDPSAKLVITGYADPKELKAAKLADTRADLARKYLGEKGIDASRITTRTGTASKEKGAEKENRRVDFIFVPEGATY
ncbi:MAG TPA: OmpA family protein [Candidatus Dormibacteraeota bacterium]|nr:OmpA family protein [Candidatus Dormibacteraeota bacterium]